MERSLQAIKKNELNEEELAMASSCQVPIWTAFKVANVQVETFEKSLSSMLHVSKV
jgi:hypothetical protein